MNQPTHAWIALRALALLDDLGAVPDLVTLLMEQAHLAPFGAWLPDLTQRLVASDQGTLEHHALKFAPAGRSADHRAIVAAAQLQQRLSPGSNLLALAVGELPSRWWTSSYRGTAPDPHTHVANRALGAADTLTRQLLMGDYDVQAATKRDPGPLEHLHCALSRPRDVALAAFELSHFVADAHQPNHCDQRQLSSYSTGVGGLHRGLETYWGKLVGKAFKCNGADATDLVGLDAIALARQCDPAVYFVAPSRLPNIPGRGDVWQWLVDTCRTAFAVSCVIAPPAEWLYNGTMDGSFDEIFPESRKGLLRQVTSAVLTDAVCATAAVWAHVWQEVTAKTKGGR